jgi:type I restriction enzyme S subunit
MDNKLTTKHFYVTEIPNDWEVKDLGQLFEFKNGINAGKESYGTGIKFINVMEIINNDSFTADEIPGTVQITKEQKLLYLVQNGDVLFNRTSETTDEIGLSSVYYGSEEVVFGGFVIRGKPIGRIVNDNFKRYCFRSQIVRDQIVRSGQGAIRTNIGQGDLEKVKIPLPPLPEQRAIASLLSTWDKAISKTQELIAQKKLRKKWLMQNLLTGKKRLKGVNGEWRKVGAGDIFKSVSIKGNGNEELLSATQDKGIIPRNILEARVTMPTGETSSFKLVEKGDFVISLRSFQGGLEYSNYRGIVSPAYTVLKPKQKIHDEFYKQYYKSYEFIGRLATAVIGIRDGKQISYNDFCIVKIPFPSIEEQTAIAIILQTADKEIQLLKAKLDKLKDQKKGLMQVLLTGKKRLKYKS